MAKLYLINENFTCPKEQIMQITHLSSYLADTICNLFKNSMKPDINSIENSVDPDQLASEEACLSRFILFPILHGTVSRIALTFFILVPVL